MQTAVDLILVAPFVIIFRNVLFPAITLFLVADDVQEATLRAEELVFDHSKSGLQEMDSDSENEEDFLQRLQFYKEGRQRAFSGFSSNFDDYNEVGDLNGGEEPDEEKEEPEEDKEDSEEESEGSEESEGDRPDAEGGDNNSTALQLREHIL